MRSASKCQQPPTGSPVCTTCQSAIGVLRDSAMRSPAQLIEPRFRTTEWVVRFASR